MEHTTMRTAKLQSLALLVLAHFATAALGQTAHSLTLVAQGAFYTLTTADLEVTKDVRVARWEISYEWQRHLRSNESYQFAVERVAYDCVEQRYASLSEELYADRSSTTPIKSTMSATELLSWKQAEPRSIQERQLRAVCSTH
jgi:hypothetical protein